MCVTSTGQTVRSKGKETLAVEVVKSTKNDGYVERIISITDKVGILKYCFLFTSYHFFPLSGKPHQVTQFQILNWNSQGKCSYPQTIITVVEEVNKVQRRTDNKPIVVHCRSEPSLPTHDDPVSLSSVFSITIALQSLSTIIFQKSPLVFIHGVLGHYKCTLVLIALRKPKITIIVKTTAS